MGEMSYQEILNTTLENYREQLEANIFSGPRILVQPIKLSKKHRKQLKKLERKERKRIAKDVLKGRHDCGGW